jgi:hypothetical protein
MHKNWKESDTRENAKTIADLDARVKRLEAKKP